MNKRGGVGNFFVTLIVIVMVVIAFTFFVLIASVWGAFSKQPVGSNVVLEDERSFFEYINTSHLYLENVRFEVASGERVDKAVADFEYLLEEGSK